MTKITYIPGEIANAAIDEHGNRKPVTRTQHIFDDAKGKSQAAINAETDSTFALHQSEINALDSQNYVTVNSYAELPETGATDTIYRVAQWDGTQVVDNKYSEYAWDASIQDYRLLDVKAYTTEVYDISAAHSRQSYASLADALGTNGANVPANRRSGGMSIKFVQSSDNKYVQYRLMTSQWSINIEDWSKCDNNTLVQNPVFLKVIVDSVGKVLIGIREDGNIYFGVGVPSQIIEYIQQKIDELSLNEYADIVTFLGNLIYGDKNLQTLLNEYNFKIDVVRNQETYNIAQGSRITTVDNPLLLPLHKGNKLRLRTEGNSMALYPNGQPLMLYYIINSTTRINFTHLYDSNWHEYEIPADAIGVAIYLTTNTLLLQDATITLYLEEYSGAEYEHDKMYSGQSQFNLLPAIPSYYFTNNYLDNKIEVINSAIRSCSTDCDAFIWITDVHWEKWGNAGYSPSLIKYIIDRTAISKVLGGGDYLNGYAGDGTTIYDFMNKMRQAIGSNKFYTAYGNHEFIDSDSYKDVFYGLRQRLNDVVYGDANKTYFYHDDLLTKTRYIALGSYGYRPSGGSYTSLYDSTQLAWFTGTALNVQSGWTIIIFTHSLYAIAGDDYHLIVQGLNGAQDFINAIDNYNGNGTIACVLIGHTHVDRIHQNENGVPYIISACDRYEQNVLNGGYELILPKTLGTKNEQHFEVVVIDHQNKNIKLIAIGSPSLSGRENNIGSEVEIREVTY